MSPPDDYILTVDASGFDPLVGGGATWGCLVPRQGTSAAPLDTRWFYLGAWPIPKGATYPPQLDIANSADPAHTPPPQAYLISHCTPMGDPTVDPRTDNYLRSVQYPVLASAALEPVSVATYKPWYVTVAVDIRADKRPSIGCNDIKGQASIERRAGWDQTLKVFGQGAGETAADLAARNLTPQTWPYGPVLPDGAWSQGRELQVTTPSWDDVRTGKVTFEDWPMVNVSMPILKGTDPKLCPLTAGVIAKYPKYPGDPDADFQFPQQAWVRGLLTGYLDGGEVPVSTTGCPAGVAICPAVNTLYLSADDIMPKDPMTMIRKTFDVSNLQSGPTMVAVFDAVRGQQGYSPICKIKVYDPALTACSASICTAGQLQRAAATAFLSIPDSYVHCLVSSGGRP